MTSIDATVGGQSTVGGQRALNSTPFTTRAVPQHAAAFGLPHSTSLAACTTTQHLPSSLLQCHDPHLLQSA